MPHQTGARPNYCANNSCSSSFSEIVTSKSLNVSLRLFVICFMAVWISQEAQADLLIVYLAQTFSMYSPSHTWKPANGPIEHCWFLLCILLHVVYETGLSSSMYIFCYFESLNVQLGTWTELLLWRHCVCCVQTVHWYLYCGTCSWELVECMKKGVESGLTQQNETRHPFYLRISCGPRLQHQFLEFFYFTATTPQVMD